MHEKDPVRSDLFTLLVEDRAWKRAKKGRKKGCQLCSSVLTTLIDTWGTKRGGGRMSISRLAKWKGLSG